MSEERFTKDSEPVSVEMANERKRCSDIARHYCSASADPLLRYGAKKVLEMIESGDIVP